MVLPVLLLTLVLLVAATKILVIKADTSTDLAYQPCRPTSLVGLPALSAYLPCFVPATDAHVEVDFFAKLNALSNLHFLDICGENTQGSQSDCFTGIGYLWQCYT